MNVLITAGPTREYLDTVRFISNPSSGKMGYAIAAASAAAGHHVTLISGPVALGPLGPVQLPAGVELVRVTSAAEMAAAAKAAWPAADAAIMTAAVCDYRPARRASRKRAKATTSLSLTLVPTEDIARALGRTKRPHQVLLAFALEDHDARAHAEAKLARKNCDAIALNDPGTINADQAQMDVLIRGAQWQHWRRGGKAQIAARLVRLVARLHRQALKRRRAGQA